MNKQEFLDTLRRGLSSLPREEAEEHLSFYREMIDDRMEEGLTEEEAVREIGTPEEILGRILIERTPAEAKKEQKGLKREFRWWEILLLILGSPIWLSLLIAAFAVAFSLYAVLWSVIISLWAGEVSLWGSALGVTVAGLGFILSGYALLGLVFLGAGLICAGISVFFFLGCAAATKGTLLLTRKIGGGIKHLFVRGEAA